MCLMCRVQVLHVHAEHDSGSERRSGVTRTGLDREKRIRAGRSPGRAHPHHGYRTG